MLTKTWLPVGIWLLTVLVISLALFVWWPTSEKLTIYGFFPLLGLLAFSLMWVHYIAGAIRRKLGVPYETLAFHFRLTGYLVLIFILAHPSLFYLQLYIDGLGLPYESVYKVYQTATDRLAILAGIIALLTFLSFELYRFFREKPWWKYVEWANIAAMLLILWHGFTLGGELRQPWFQVIWAFYAITFIAAVTYVEVVKRREIDGTI
jgi:hypothetical protein